MAHSPIDILSAGASALLLLLYFAFLRLKTRSNPLYTSQAANAQLRARWVVGVMSQNKDILAVQTLRNSTMAATFLASTSVVLVLGILNLITKSESVTAVSGLKLMLALLDLFVAFFGFAMSIRLYHHVGYMLGMPQVPGYPALDPVQVARHLNRGAAFYSIGMRAFYLLIPIVFWFLGPVFMLVATLGTLILLFSNDRAAGDEVK